MTSPPKRDARALVTPKVQQVAKRLLIQLHMVLRTARIHEPTNQAVLVATENLKDSINSLWASLGFVRIQFVDDVVYLNDVRLRFETAALEQLKWLRGELLLRDMGGLAFTKPVDTSGLRDFLVLLARPLESAGDVGRLRAALLDMKHLALELLGPKTFADEDAVPEIRIDRKTFALQTYAKSVVAAREAVAAMREGRDLFDSHLPVLRIMQDLVDIATERVNLLLKMCAIKKADDYPYNHAANTAVLAVAIGNALGIARLGLVDLGMCAFFADLGFTTVNAELLERPDRVSEPERREIVDGLIRSARALIGKGRINAAAMHRVVVCTEHHEPFSRADGPSPPRELHVYSRIVAIADAYDALTTTRPWRSGYSPDEALRMLSKEAGTRFDPVIVRTFLNLMGLYPLGTLVCLDSGEVGLVYHNSNDPRLATRPWVKIVRDAGGAPVRRTLIRNLAVHEGVGGSIVGHARDVELEGLDAGAAIIL